MTHASASGSLPSKTADFLKRTGPRSKSNDRRIFIAVSRS
jgi:hypothetical protein